MSSASRPAPSSSTAEELGELFARERAPMLRLAVLMVGSAQIAEEVVQDAFEAVGVRWGSLDRPGGYLRTCVVNGCRAVVRRRELERRVAGEAVPRAPVGPDHLAELRDALDRLGERQRTVIVLRYFVDVSDDEIAAVLDCRPATVRSLAHRALAVLREELS